MCRPGLESSIRVSLQRADQEIRHVLKRLEDSPEISLTLPLYESPEEPMVPLEAEAKYEVMFRDADTQTPVDLSCADLLPGEEEATEVGEPEAAGTPDHLKPTQEGQEEQNIPIRLQMDAADWYRRRAGAQIWDVHSQVYIQTTERTCLHLKDDNATRPPYMQVTIEDVHARCGDTAQFDAVIEGAAPLTVTWYKDNALLKESDRVLVVRDDRKYSLILHNTEYEDGGVYACVARNNGGEVSCKAELVMRDDREEQVSQKPQKRRKLKSFFEVKEEIGRGSFGFVKRVVHKGNAMVCAAKFVPMRSKTRQQVCRERDILSEVSHSNVTLLLDSFETKKTLILILEICCGEELLDHLFQKSSVTENEVKVYIRQILEAVVYLHEKSILHLDIKPSNILMVHPDREDLKLCDFGFGQKINPFEKQYSQYGSPDFVSPEIACQSPVSRATDIWPVGVITYLCLVCACPFSGQNDRETLLNVQKGQLSWTCPGRAGLSEEAKDFMRNTILVSPELRLTAKECVQHKWFQRSLMCYKSILVMRSIPELLRGNEESSSLGVPRHMVENSSSSSSSGSSSDNESDVSPTARDCNPSLELHLSIFKMSEQDRQQYMLETETGGDEKDHIEKKRGDEKELPVVSTELHDKQEPCEKDESGKKLKEEETEEMLIDSVQTSPGKPPLFKALTIEVGDLLSKQGKTGNLVRVSSADSALVAEGVNKHQLVCVPRQSIINSTFYNQVGEGPGSTPIGGSMKQKEFIKHRERARRSLMKAGYSPKILSGLREPLLEQFAMEQRLKGHDQMSSDHDALSGSLKKSVSFDTAKSALRSSFKYSSRSRSLDDSKSRPLSVYRAPAAEETHSDHTSDDQGSSSMPDVTVKHHSMEPLLDDNLFKSLTKSNSERIVRGVTERSTQNSSPIFTPSTQRPLSAGDVGSENTIIAVLHQHPLKDPGSAKECSSSATTGEEESTIIAFIKQKNLPVPEATPLSVNIPEDATTKTSTPPLGIQSDHKVGGVRVTIKTISERDSFLLTPAGTSPTPVQPQEDTRKEETFPEATTERTTHTVQFSDDHTSIAVIHQGPTDVSTTFKDHKQTVQLSDHPGNNVKMVASTSKDLQSQLPTATVRIVDRTHADALTAELAHGYLPVGQMPVATYHYDSGDRPIADISLAHEHDGDSQTLGPHSLIQSHDEEKTFPNLLCESMGDSQGIKKDIWPSIFSGELSTALESLVGEMADLSEEMDVLADQKVELSHMDPTFPSMDVQSTMPTEVQKGGYTIENYCAMETEPSTCPSDPAMKLSQVTSVSQCSFYDPLYQARHSPLTSEQFEEFTIESRSSSKTLISHSGSSGTGRRSDNFSDFDEAGRQSEVSLVEIGELHHDKTSSSADHLELEHTHCRLFEFYDIDAFPVEPLESNECSSAIHKFNLTSLVSQQTDDSNQGVREEESHAAKDLELKSSTPLLSLQPSDPGKTKTKEKKGSSSRKRIKLFRPHIKSETPGKPSDQSLKQKVKASVANISRIIKGKQGNGHERKQEYSQSGVTAVTKTDLTEQASSGRLSSQGRKKPSLPTFKLPGISAKDKAPAFVEELNDQTVVIGHLVTLSCRSAQPVTDIEWFKDGLTIHGSERVLISSTLKNYHLLTILVVNAQDLGIYACVATNALGNASTCCIIKKAEIPCCPTSPEIAQVYKDGALIVWKPVESNTPVTYFLQYRREGEEWRMLTLDISDCCYSTRNLSVGHNYSFRIACISKAGVGPYSNPSPSVRIGRPSPVNAQIPERKASGEAGENGDGGETLTLPAEGRKGRFSLVRPCREKSTRRVLAAKIIPYTDNNKEATLMEYMTLKTLHHTNIVRLNGAFLSPRHLVLVLELCEGKELLRSLSAGLSFSEMEVRDYLWQMLSALEFIHGKQILHLDLRSENMIVTEHKLLKILDFGHAQFYSPDNVNTTQATKDYLEAMAPELLEGQGAVPPTDIWSVGITAFIMLSGDYPFNADTMPDLEKSIKRGLIKFTRCYAGLSGGAVRFLQSTLWANPWGRPSASDCLKLPWLQEAGLASLQQPPVLFPSTKLRRFLRERRKNESPKAINP